jgi:uncharacterized coiled-coil protein SlyX
MSSTPGHPKSPEDRVADLEFLFTHLERQVADLSRLLLDQQARMDRLEKALRVLEGTEDDDEEDNDAKDLASETDE